MLGERRSVMRCLMRLYTLSSLSIGDTMRVLSHDAFARFEVLRQQVTGHTVDAVGGFGDRLYVCDECGRVNRTPKGKPFAYRYGTQSDGFGARVEWTEGVFCSKSCWHSAYTL